jgi:DHA2 family multidrug resistance protein-like MFS transporter
MSRRRWLALTALCLPALLIAMDLSVLYLAVPKISAALDPSPAQLLWIADSYGFLLAGLLIPMGALGDRIGSRRLLQIGAAAFGVLSVVAAYAAHPGLLIAARAALGVAGATLAPSTLALIGRLFPDKTQRSRAIGVWATSLSVGGALGPLAGGVLLKHFWWGSVFLIAVPVMVLLVATAPLLLPEHRDEGADRIDVASVLLGLVGILGVMYGIKELGQGAHVLPSSAAIATGIIAGHAFVRRQLRLREPVVDVRLFREPPLALALVANTVGFFLVLGITLQTDQQLQLVAGLDPLETGIATVPMFIVFILGALASPTIMARVAPAPAMAGGFVVAAAGLIVLVTAGPDSAAVWPIIVGQVILAAGLAPIFPLVTNLVLAASPPDRSGAASGLAETTTEFGGAAGIALLGILTSIVYRAQLDLPAAIPTSTGTAVRDSIGSATNSAGELDHALAASVLYASRSAFTDGVHAAAIGGAAVAIVMAVTAARTLRRDPKQAVPADQE